MPQAENRTATATHGSLRRLLAYRNSAPAVLDAAILQSISAKTHVRLEWIHPLPNQVRPEPTGISFLKLDANQHQAWREFWPQTGNPPNWDGVARYSGEIGSSWILIEAKANHPELCSPPDRQSTRL